MNLFQEMYAIRELYYETHIFPTEENFLQQINNTPMMYLVLYWLKLEHLYDDFLEEEMDIEAIQLMEENDLQYFNVHRTHLFRQYVRWLQTPIDEIELNRNRNTYNDNDNETDLDNDVEMTENMNTIPRYIQTKIL